MIDTEPSRVSVHLHDGGDLDIPKRGVFVAAMDYLDCDDIYLRAKIDEAGRAAVLAWTTTMDRLGVPYRGSKKNPLQDGQT